MNEHADIKYISRKDIDTAKWDACIERADNGLIYACSFYLDAMAENWDALVMNDYNAVMPLTWKKKYGIHYLYQPFLTAQSGVFGNHIDGTLLNKFLKAVPGKFRYWDICLNRQNCFELKDFNLYHRMNYVLDLDKPYELIYQSYRENIQRNIRKSQELGNRVQKNFEAEKVIAIALKQMKTYIKEADGNAEKFRNIYKILHSRQQAITYGIVSPQQELLSSCVFFFSHNRAFYILVGNQPGSKTTGASHALIDAFIKDHSGKKMLLDFEGSDIPNLAFFYSSFGAAEEKYAAVKLNRLPFYMKWLKS